jgi:aryl-alcohol dehydrogenase-like predicted oxidoreductase
MTGQVNKAGALLDDVEMGLGAWSWGDRSLWNYGRGYDDTDIEEAFHASLSAGVNMVDTAEVYGSGLSEHLLGQFLKTNHPPILVATKFMPYPWRFSRKS